MNAGTKSLGVSQFYAIHGFIIIHMPVNTCIRKCLTLKNE